MGNIYRNSLDGDKKIAMYHYRFLRKDAKVIDDDFLEPNRLVHSQREVIIYLSPYIRNNVAVSLIFFE